MIVLNMHTFAPRDIVARFDPPPGLTGRLGGVHLKRRTVDGRSGLDLVLIVGYAFPNDAEEDNDNAFGRTYYAFTRGDRERGHNM